MADYVAFTPLDWQALLRLRAETQPDATSLMNSVQSVSPYVDEDDRALVTHAVASFVPRSILVLTGLRVAPEQYAGPAAEWAAQTDRLDDLLVEASRVGPWQTMSADRGVFLAYYSEAHRLITVGLADDATHDATRYDGPPAILQAIGGRLTPDPAGSVLYSDGEVQAIARALAEVDPAQYPVGEVAPLYDYYDETYPEGAALDTLCRADLVAVRALYQEAAAAGWGMKLLT